MIKEKFFIQFILYSGAVLIQWNKANKYVNNFLKNYPANGNHLGVSFKRILKNFPEKGYPIING